MSRQGRTGLIIVCAITGLVVIGLIIEDPSLLFGLGATSTCEGYNSSDNKYQVMFPEKCGCLYPKQAYAIETNRIIKDAVTACFEDEMKRCRGWEKIGKLYRECVGRLTGIPDRED